MKKFLFLSFLLTIISSNFFGQTADKRVLFTVAGQPVTVDEFKYVYTKNNINNQADFSEKSLTDYMDLFTKFRLKVKQSEDMKLDTIDALKSELATYRKQLAKAYLTDKEVFDRLENEAYDRMQYEISVGHLLVKVAEDAIPKDTLIAYNKAVALRKSILKNNNFEDIAKQSSDDPSAKTNLGKLGYLSAFQTVYPFENAMYETKVGEISMPIRSKYGYHLVKVYDKRIARGSVNVAHIVITTPDKLMGNADSITFEKANKIYNDIKSGSITFEEAVNQYSEDRKSKAKGGELGFFTTGKMTETFENAAFGLKNKGDMTTPVKTSYGYHIIKLIDKKPVPPLSQIKSEIKQKIDKDARSDLSRTALTNKVKSKYGFTENTAAKDEIFTQVDSMILDGKWKPTDLTLSKNLFKISDIEVNQNDFLNFIIKNQKTKRTSNSTKAVFNNLYEDFVEQKCLDVEEKQLENEYPDFKMLMREYRDGILLFDLTDRMVWTKAVKDTAGLKIFYETDKEKYKWGNRADVDIYNCTDKGIATPTRKMLEKKKSSEAITAQLNVADSKSKVSVISGKYEKGQYELIDKTDWLPGIKPNIINADSSITIINIKQIVGPEPKLLNEAKGYIVSDYQEYLEKNWIEALKAKYPIVVNQDVLRSLIKK
jgi:peptidyl-prolyl cis-trans isomerase SurA